MRVLLYILLFFLSGSFWNQSVHSNSKESPLVSMRQRPLIVPATLHFSGLQQGRSPANHTRETTNGNSITNVLTQMNRCFWFYHLSQSMKQRGQSNECSKSNSLHLVLKYARIFVRRHYLYLFRVANNFPRAKLEENWGSRNRYNVHRQICEHILKMEVIVFIIHRKFLQHENCRLFLGYSPVLAGTYSVTWRA